MHGFRQRLEQQREAGLLIHAAFDSSHGDLGTGIISWSTLRSTAATATWERGYN